LGDLVDIALGGQAASKVDELPDPGLAGEDPDGPAQEGPVVFDHVTSDRRDGKELFRHLVVQSATLPPCRVPLSSNAA
jgi:hypothetical protein